ncbi:hypothetical protein pSalSNUABM01_082 [Salmonella phage pSal-SNUABM-01]|nr:hypothetical protein pSalSNUABM01_082 [Salmonella phage pSal-SNUABM-01]
MVYRSLKDWNKKGKMVKKGERASARSTDGTALFSNEQVKKFPTRRVNSPDHFRVFGYNSSRDYDDWDERDEAIGMLYW